ncbi:Hypothetical protein NTJ_04511 [Nesidiocoris tenuis]|uniref:Uncharacterized protein n=1 Tax=Nesidiocoris tenuis TaxID=355587 RepID=A0ABN7AMW9_9HEMI|nr:Hypothetical protein NTJ_04511 [Nesidiocoris tenuis]
MPSEALQIRHEGHHATVVSACCSSTTTRIHRMLVSRGPKIVVVAAVPYHKREVWNLGRESMDPRCGRNSVSRTAVLYDAVLRPFSKDSRTDFSTIESVFSFF